MAERSIDDRERYVGYATHCLQLARMAAVANARGRVAVLPYTAWWT